MVPLRPFRHREGAVFVNIAVRVTFQFQEKFIY
jgi:hypothetical protein